MIEEIFNEFSDNLSILNIEILLDILEKFILQSENKNLSYSSLSFFWQCADIVEAYQKNKKEMKELELECFDEKVGKNKEKIFYKNLWKKIFQKLLIINDDKRFDIKKSGINLFSQFFVAKLKTINQINNLSNEIFNEVFYIIIKNNIEGYISSESPKNKNNNEEADKEIEKDQKENTNTNPNQLSTNDNEEIILFSLQNLGKILKAFFEENKQNKNDNNKMLLDILKRIAALYQELINKKNSPEIANNILKNLYEFDSGDKFLFEENRQIFWNIIELLINYISEKKFTEKYEKSIKGSKVIQNISDTLSSCFYSKENFEILNKDESINNNINNLIDMIPKMMNSMGVVDQSLVVWVCSI